MDLFNWLNGLFSGDDTFGGINSTGSDDFSTSITNINTVINPVSGLPMINGDTSGLDIAGNPFGMDNNSDDFNDDGFTSNDFGSSTSGFGDDF